MVRRAARQAFPAHAGPSAHAAAIGQRYSQGIKFQGRYYWHDELVRHVGYQVEIRFGAELGRIVVFAICPSCFDGVDLKQPVPDPLTPGLARYTCKVCHVRFSDAKSTVFRSMKPVPLTLWAYLVLHGDLCA